jgi:hypothetical protein
LIRGKHGLGCVDDARLGAEGYGQVEVRAHGSANAMGQGGWEISGQSREIDLDFVASAPGNLRSQAVTATLVCRALSLSLSLFFSLHIHLSYALAASQ